MPERHLSLLVVMNALGFSLSLSAPTSWGAFKSSRLMDVKWCHPKLVVEVKHLAGSKTAPPCDGKEP